MKLQRITNGQRAAICALLLVGVCTLKEACAIVDAPYSRARRLVPRDYLRMNRPKKWRGQLLADLEAAYRDPAVTLYRLTELFKISGPNICKLAIQYDWPRRENLRQTRKIIRRQEAARVFASPVPHPSTRSVRN